MHIFTKPSSATLLKFTMPLPLMPPLAPRPTTARALAPGIRILVAEDDAVSRELICTRLEKWGYEVIATQNGVEAMTELRKKDAPVLAILDWMMPGLDGLEICRRTRAVKRRLYVIVLTARGTKANLVEGLGAGADDYLIKPFDKDELHARILVGLRAMEAQAELAIRVNELEGDSAEYHDRKLELLM